MNRIIENYHPEFARDKFTCPRCGVVAQQKWTYASQLAKRIEPVFRQVFLQYRGLVNQFEAEHAENFGDYLANEMRAFYNSLISRKFSFAICTACGSTTVWDEEILVYPRMTTFPDPNDDLEEEIQKLYKEAAIIFTDSPRASAALLRLCIEKLCRQLNQEGTINDCIGNLVENHNLSPKIQRALDYCRVIGNEAVHPGRIDIDEDVDKVRILFQLINDIAENLITKPRLIDERYETLPSSIRQQVQERDARED